MKVFLVVLLWCGCRGQDVVEQRALAAQAVDGEVAVLWREAQTDWIGSYDRTGHRSWASRLSGNPVIHPGERYPVVVGDHTFSILTRRGDDQLVRVETFSRDDGARVETVLGPSQDESSPVAGFVLGDHTFHYFEGQLVVVDPRNGVEIRRVPVPFAPDRVVVRGDRATLQDALSEADLTRNGEVRFDGGRGCVISGRPWKLTAHDGQLELVPAGGQSERERIAIQFAGKAAINDCAMHGTKLVMFVDATPAGEANRREVWVVEKDGHMVGRVRTSTRPPRTYPADTLPRFVPLVEDRALSMLDLERGHATWRIELPRTLLRDPVLVDGRWYLSNDSAEPELAVIDANSGELLAAKKLRGRFGLRPLGPENFGPDRLVLVRSMARPSADPMLSVLALPSLSPSAGAAIDVGSATSVFAQIPRN